MIVEFHVQDILGRNKNDPLLQDFFRPLKDRIVLEEFEDRYDFEIPSEGVTFIFRNDCLSCVQFYDDNSEDGFSGFRGNLPYGLQFSDSRVSVERKMGKPEKSLDSAMPDPLFGEILPWVRYAIGGHKLFVRFLRDSSRINLVSEQI